MPRSFGGAVAEQRFTIPGGTFDMSGDFTHMLWFRCTGFEEEGYHPYVISSGTLEDFNTLNIFLGHGDDPDDFRISIRDGSNAGTNFITNTPDGPSEHIGEWIPVVITRSGTTLTVMLFAREGAGARTTTATMAGTVSLGTSTVGARDTGPDRFFLGEIAHRSHFTEALSNAAIDDLFDGVNPQTVRDDYGVALARYFPFDQASGDETDVVSGTIVATAINDPGAALSTDPVAPYSPGPVEPAGFLIEAAGGGPIGDFTVGEPQSVRITALNSIGGVEDSFVAGVTLTSTGSLSPESVTTAAFVAGVLADHQVVFLAPASGVTLTATDEDENTGTSDPFDVLPAVVDPTDLDRFEITELDGSALVGMIAGVPRAVLLRAANEDGSTHTAFSGSVAVSAIGGDLWSGAGPTAPFVGGQLVLWVQFAQSAPAASITVAVLPAGDVVGASAVFAVEAQPAPPPPIPLPPGPGPGPGGIGGVVDRLADHTARIWRSVVTQDRYGTERTEWQVVASDVPVVLNRDTAPVMDVGAGYAPSGRRRLYVQPETDVRVRDVVQLVSGPDAPQTLQIDEPPKRPRGHHAQLDCILWRGKLPEEIES